MMAAQPTTPVALDDVMLLDVRQLAKAYRIHVRHAWRQAALAEAGLSDFPKPIRLGPKTVRFRLTDVKAYIDKLAGAGR